MFFRLLMTKDTADQFLTAIISRVWKYLEGYLVKELPGLVPSPLALESFDLGQAPVISDIILLDNVPGQTNESLVLEMGMWQCNFCSINVIFF